MAEEFQSPENKKRGRKSPSQIENVANKESILSPRFRSVAAMAGWDEEALLIATLVVEDTPERESKHKKRTSLQIKTPPSNSRRKRKAQRNSPASIIPSRAIKLDNEEPDLGKDKKTTENGEVKEKKIEESEGAVPAEGEKLPCIDKLREELSCAICLEICFEPSTTACGHSFCKKCLRFAADKCGKRCPKCRQLIGNGRSCTVNTVLWNTIQLLFPEEVKARKATETNRREAYQRSPRVHSNGAENATPNSRTTTTNRSVRRRSVASQAEDAALAFRLQREEFMEAFRGNNEQARASLQTVRRDNLRSMASRAFHLRVRGRPM